MRKSKYTKFWEVGDRFLIPGWSRTQVVHRIHGATIYYRAAALGWNPPRHSIHKATKAEAETWTKQEAPEEKLIGGNRLEFTATEWTARAAGHFYLITTNRPTPTGSAGAWSAIQIDPHGLERVIGNGLRKETAFELCTLEARLRQSEQLIAGQQKPETGQ